MLQFDPKLRELLVRNGGTPTGEFADSTVGSRMTAVIARLHKPDRPIEGLFTVSRMGHIITGRVRLADIVRIRQHPNVASLKASSLFADKGSALAQLYRIQQNRAVIPVNNTGSGSFKPLVGVVDWGMDFAHPAFQDEKGRCRVIGLWDQRTRLNKHSPGSYGYGTEYNHPEISAACKTSNPYKQLGYDPADIDPKGQGTHGTHVASIAAGRAWQSGAPQGIAPKADVLFVHLRSDDTHPQDSLGDSARVLEAVDYLLRKAGNRPISINLSLGRTGDAKDGTTPVEQALDAALTIKPNRAISMSTGNYYAARMHASENSVQAAGRLRWQIPNKRRYPSELEIWYRGTDRMSVRVKSKANDIDVRIDPAQSVVVKNKNGSRLLMTCYSRLKDPNNGDNQVNLFIHPSASGDEWQINVESYQSKRPQFHAWIERTTQREQSRFHKDDADPEYSIGTICSGHNTIATAAYNRRARAKPMAEFSSSGPSRDLRMVPVIAAPGDLVAGAKSSTKDRLGFRTRSQWIRKSGTSMAAPAVTGAVALLFQEAKRPMWADEVKDALILTADTPYLLDSRLRTGAGVLNVDRAIKFISRIE